MDVTARLLEALGPDAVLTAPEDLSVYAYDAYSQERTPRAVAVPRDAEQVAAIVRIAYECGEPIVPRGAGTGLCGGAVPIDGGIVISFARMNAVLTLDTRNRRARVQPGLINLDLSKGGRAARALLRARSVEAENFDNRRNIGTNAGGPHASPTAR